MPRFKTIKNRLCKFCHAEFGPLHTAQVFCCTRCQWEINVDRNGPNGCWLWNGYCPGGRYGRMTVNGENRGAHVVSWELHNAAVREGEFVCHKCDNPRCVNPSHLYLGDAALNMKDKCQKGRQASGESLSLAMRNSPNLSRGESHPSAKLTDEDVATAKAMHKSGASFSLIARTFGVCHSSISRIISGRSRRVKTGEGGGG